MKIGHNSIWDEIARTESNSHILYKTQSIIHKDNGQTFFGKVDYKIIDKYGHVTFKSQDFKECLRQLYKLGGEKNA